MTTTINADTIVGGAVVTADASGELALQSGGVTKLTVASSGVTLASALPIASGGTNSTATPTAGGVGYGTGTAHAYTSAGTSGYFLQSNGASAPSWVAPSSGALTYLSTTSTAGASSLAISLSSYTATYNAFKIVCTNFYGQSTTADFEVRINNSTSSYISGGGGGRDTQGSGSFGWGARNTSYIMSSYSSTDTLASPSVTVFECDFYNMNSSSEKWAIGTMVQALKTGSVGGNGVGGVLGGMWVNSSTPTSINIVSSGSFVATVLLYGIKTS